MKININKVITTPKNLPFNLCVYGKLSDEILAWAKFHKFGINISDKYTNIILTKNVNFDDIFEPIKTFDNFDGFSPNLNKNLHLGHLSNLILAKSIQKMGLVDKTIAILGDTINGDVEKEKAFNKYIQCLQKFDYKLDNIYYASEQLLTDNNLMIDGSGEYVGTKIFNIDGEFIVGLKSNGQSSYFYQDVALQQKLIGQSLYLTGIEQTNHFNLLKKLYPNITHKGMGLIMIDDKKMSSSSGNVYFLEDIFELLKNDFKDEKLCYNIIAGQILKYSISTSKNINLKDITNVKTSLGLYISYTMSRMFSAGIEKNNTKLFNSKKMKYYDFKSKYDIEPNLLFNSLVELCKDINALYVTHIIKNDKENKIMFQKLTDDLILGCNKLGLFIIDKV